MPFTGQDFKSRHNHKLSSGQATKAASIANAMMKSGVPEGEAIATANARAEKRKRATKKMYPTANDEGT